MCFPLQAVAIFILALAVHGDEDAAQSQQCTVAAAIMETAPDGTQKASLCDISASMTSSGGFAESWQRWPLFSETEKRKDREGQVARRHRAPDVQIEECC